jgi:uncharacterized protein (DUF305 family)
MKRQRMTRLAVLCVAVLGGGTVLADPPTPTDVAEAKMHHGMCRGGWPGTGNADQDFALRMRHHHLKGVDLARDELARGTDPQLRAFAQREVDDEGREVAELESWLRAHDVAMTDWPMRDWPMRPMRFEAMDTNHDGMLTAAELGTTAPWYRRFGDVVANHDGFVSQAELDALHPWQLRFYGVDTNGDGFLDATEVTSAHPWYPTFGDADTNDDGRVSWAELQAFHPGPLRFASVDLNNDGVIDATEVTPTHWWYPHFAAADLDHDGRVSRSEVDAFHAAHRRMDRDDDGDVDQWDCHDRMTRDGTPHAAPMPPDFAGMDKNGDGFITMTELPQSDWARNHFTAVDSDGDGKISRAEMDAHQAQMDAHDH